MTMHVRQKGKAIRVTFADTAGSSDIDYIAIDTPTCWSATFNAWGKKADAPIINLNGKKFLVVLEEVL